MSRRPIVLAALLLLLTASSARAGAFRHRASFQLLRADSTALPAAEIRVVPDGVRMRDLDGEWHLYAREEVALVTDRYGRVAWPPPRPVDPGRLPLDTDALLRASQGLKSYALLSYLGIGLGFTGTTLAVLGARNDNDALLGAGAGASLVGFGFSLAAPAQVARAGEWLETFAATRRERDQD